MTEILSIDLGKFKSVACLYQQKAQPVFRTFATTPAALHDLLVELEPDRVVIEVCGIADSHRFKNGREVGAYAGLVPREFQSGMMQRAGRITKQGPAVLRRLLVQIAWGMKRRSARVSALFERLTHGQRTRRKKAIVAVARKILIWCWTMLRDGTTWREVPAT